MDQNNTLYITVQIYIVLSIQPYGIECYWKHLFPSYIALSPSMLLNLLNC